MTPSRPQVRTLSDEEEQKAAAREKAETEIERLNTRIMTALEEISSGGQDINRAVNMVSITKDLLMLRRRQAEVVLNQPTVASEPPDEGVARA